MEGRKDEEELELREKRKRGSIVTDVSTWCAKYRSKFSIGF
jgi:hypothetical protein